MITSAENRSWLHDVPLGEGYGRAGLPAPSTVRPCKIATIEARSADYVGKVDDTIMDQVAAHVRRYLGLI